MRRAISIVGGIILALVCSAIALADGSIVISLEYESSQAIIGHPISINYEVSGGSGQFYIEVGFSTMLGSRLMNGGPSSEVTDAKGTWTGIVDQGIEGVAFLQGRDLVTDQEFYYESSQWLPVLPNPDIPVSIVSNLETVQCGNPIQFSYQIKCNNNLKQAFIWWTVYDQSLEPTNFAGQTNLTQKSGTIFYTPMYGNKVSCTIYGITTQDQYFYAESDYISVTGRVYAPITISLEYASTQAFIGQPLSIDYEVNGGSGQFYIEVGFSTMLGSHLMNGGSSSEVTCSKGTWTGVVDQGIEGVAYLQGHDLITNQEFYYESSQWISVLPNPEIPVLMKLNMASANIGETISVSYDIEYAGTINNAYIWWTIYDYSVDSDDFCEVSNMVGYTMTTLRSDTVKYTPHNGNYITCTIWGTTDKDIFFYAESKPICITGDKYELNLPQSVSSIGSSAFKGIDAKVVIIPASVTYISDDAFTGSQIQMIVGHSQYVRNYALKHFGTYCDGNYYFR